MAGVVVPLASMTESETSARITAHFHDGRLELRSKESPDAWIIAADPVSVEQ
jgi:hypothetical protein